MQQLWLHSAAPACTNVLYLFSGTLADDSVYALNSHVTLGNQECKNGDVCVGLFLLDQHFTQAAAHQIFTQRSGHICLIMGTA